MYRFYTKYIGLICLSIIWLTACSNNGTENTSDISSSESNRNKITVLDDSSQKEKSIENEQGNQENKGTTFVAKVIKVIDGDTIKIKLSNGNEETIRLLLIDTPETVHPSKPVQPFGKEASQFSKNLMPKSTNIEVEPGISERDKYGRLLAYVYVDGKMVNKLLLEKGLARVAYVYAPNTKYIDEFEAIQKVAQKKEIGIWSIENYATSRGFNDTKEEESTQEEAPLTSNECQKPLIKGNINSDGEKIYHLPSGQYYNITKAEEMFCTEKEALSAGFRKSQR